MTLIVQKFGGTSVADTDSLRIVAERIIECKKNGHDVVVVPSAMGSAGAQARSMFSQLVPETRTSEFFGFFGFLGKSAAMIGTFLYGIASTTFDSRVAILSITVVILAGTYLTSKVDLEEGIRVAEEEDARNRLAAQNQEA